MKKKVFRLLKHTIIILLLLLLVVVVVIKGSLFKHEKEERIATVEKDLKVSQKMLDGYRYQEAIDYLMTSEYREETPIIKQAQIIKAKEKSQVPYKGEVLAVYFPRMWEMGMRPEEYQKSLTQKLEILYEKNYLLIDPQMAYVTNRDQTISKNPFKFPSDKKPLIIIFADLDKGGESYNKLTIGARDTLKNLTVTEDDVKEGPKEGMIILSEFIQKNPSFSYGGMKGVVATTGYDRVLGYDIKDTANQKDIKDFEKIVTHLFEKGWRFASMSYSYSEIFDEEPIDITLFKEDLRWWKEYVGVHLPKANMYVMPKGSQMKVEYGKVLKDGDFDLVADKGEGIGTNFGETMVWQKMVDGMDINPELIDEMEKQIKEKEEEK